MIEAFRSRALYLVPLLLACGSTNGPECQLNSDCEAGFFCGEAQTCEQECQVDGDCSAGVCDAIGRCRLVDAGGPMDAGRDGGRTDAFVLMDAGADAGPADLGEALDSGKSDLGPPDLGPPDLGPPDLGAVDMGSAGSPVGALLINEVDYDQPDSDAQEFIELLNTATTPISLEGVRLLLINGSTNAEYETVDLTGTLSAGGRVIIAGDEANGGLLSDSDLAGAEQIVRSLPGTNLIQNGGPDGILLFHVPSTTLIDSLAYEGTMPAYSTGGSTYPIGSGASPVPDAPTVAQSLCRLPDGTDTGDDGADFSLCALTAGGPNASL
ncbi:MAG: lamin tail domain-containing protein [Deltaproteobacteria bacterium]|nr:lamin tail domain-containing protein [Deltaproteobacteria bacterium]